MSGVGSALSALLLGLEQGRRAGPTQWQGRGSSGPCSGQQQGWKGSCGWPCCWVGRGGVGALLVLLVGDGEGWPRWRRWPDAVR